MTRCAYALPSRIVGRQLLVKGQPMHFKGVNWNPVRKGGSHPKDLDFRGFVTADAELMAKAGINAVRTYEPITDTEVLDVLWAKGIQVVSSVYVCGTVPLEAIRERVLVVKDHPAIVMWAVGNEWNYNGLYANLAFPEAMQKVKTAIDMIKALDGTHPVATVYGEIPPADIVRAMANVDAWGINRYSGIDFGDLFNRFAPLTDKPMFMGEYGADAFDARRRTSDEGAQARATSTLTQQIVQASSRLPGGVCLGGFIFEFADEWWKDGSGKPEAHDVGGVSPGGGPYPDLTFNEEWWGLVHADGRPREAFWAYAHSPIPGSHPSASGSALPTDGLAEDGLAAETPLGPRPREAACGAHAGCAGRLGLCCPPQPGAEADPCCGGATWARVNPFYA